MDKSVDKPVGKSEEAKKSAEKLISLRPLEFEEAVADLLKVSPKPHKRVGEKRRPHRQPV